MGTGTYGYKDIEVLGHMGTGSYGYNSKQDIWVQLSTVRYCMLVYCIIGAEFLKDLAPATCMNYI